MAYKWDNEAWKMITCWDERGTQDGFFFLELLDAQYPSL